MDIHLKTSRKKSTDIYFNMYLSQVLLSTPVLANYTCVKVGSAAYKYSSRGSS